jgi:hypothetical protein
MHTQTHAHRKRAACEPFHPSPPHASIYAQPARAHSCADPAEHAATTLQPHRKGPRLQSSRRRLPRFHMRHVSFGRNRPTSGTHELNSKVNSLQAPTQAHANASTHTHRSHERTQPRPAAASSEGAHAPSGSRAHAPGPKSPAPRDGIPAPRTCKSPGWWRCWPPGRPSAG